VLLLDEPAAGLDSDETVWLGRRIRELCATGTGVLLIDHDVALVLNVCDYVYVLDFGVVIAQGPPDVIRADRAVAEAYLGAVRETPVVTA
jgi:ABC-type branched-subunit amino acid transport system ATPase component